MVAWRSRGNHQGTVKVLKLSESPPVTPSPTKPCLLNLSKQCHHDLSNPAWHFNLLSWNVCPWVLSAALTKLPAQTPAGGFAFCEIIKKKTCASPLQPYKSYSELKVVPRARRWLFSFSNILTHFSGPKVLFLFSICVILNVIYDLQGAHWLSSLLLGLFFSPMTDTCFLVLMRGQWAMHSWSPLAVPCQFGAVCSHFGFTAVNSRSPSAPS